MLVPVTQLCCEVTYGMGKFFRMIILNYCPSQKNSLITVKAAVQSDDIQDMFHLPLLEEAYLQFCEMDIYLQLVETDNQADSWSYIWGSVGVNSRGLFIPEHKGGW
jgi:hypothetical protein